jgi:signal transduction histidine kinase
LSSGPSEEPEAKEAAYRIAQEALHNTVKHARASRVKIRIECALGRMTIEISNDGVGFDSEGNFPGHLGLRSMRERASRLGGALEVESALDGGTRIRARIPDR